VTTTIADVRTALATAATQSGLRTSAYIEDTVNPPCAQVERREMDPRTVFTGTRNIYGLRVRGYFLRTAEVAGQKAIDAYCDLSGAKSVKLAIEDSDNWNGEVDYAQVVFISDTSIVAFPDAEYLSVYWDVEVAW
jgi:hypothetical protein